MAKAADISEFQINVEKPQASEKAPEPRQKDRRIAATALITKGFRVKPEAARQFDMLKVEVEAVNGKDKGPALIAEALNLLFTKYGKEPVA